MFALFATLLAVLGALLPANVALAEETGTFTVATPENMTITDGTIQGKVGEGNLTDLPLQAASGSTVILTLTPDSDYRLTNFLLRDGNEVNTVSYTRNDDTSTGVTTVTFSMPSHNVIARATFSEKNPIPVWVGETKVTNKNKNDVLDDGGSVKYDVESKTLTLTNANITGSSAASYPMAGVGSAGIYSVDPLTINLVGDNTISSEADAGICVVGDAQTSQGLTIAGGGTLTVTNAKSEYSPGIAGGFGNAA